MRGRKPKPTALKLAMGNPEEHRARLNLAEPQLPPGLPRCPAFSTGGAWKEWRRTCAVLTASGVMRSGDRGAVAVYCQSWGRCVRLEQRIRQVEAAAAETGRDATLVTAPSGYPMTNPLCGMANKTRVLMLRAAAELGITPVARSRVHAVQSGGSVEDDERFFGAPTIRLA